jgi:hypothetical protein
VLALDNFTLSAGFVLCNDSHVVTAFALHGSYQVIIHSRN